MYHGDPAAEGMRAAHLDRVFNAIQEHYPEAERDPMTGAAYIMGANCYYIMGDTEESGYLHVEVYAGNDLLRHSTRGRRPLRLRNASTESQHDTQRGHGLTATP